MNYCPTCTKAEPAVMKLKHESPYDKLFLAAFLQNEGTALLPASEAALPKRCAANGLATATVTAVAASSKG